MSVKLENLAQQLREHFGARVGEPTLRFGELSIEVDATNYLAVAMELRDNPALRFEQLLDLSGIDYSEHSGWQGKRFAVVNQLISLTHNWRLRLRVFAEDEDFPVLTSVTGAWLSRNSIATAK